MISKDIKWSFNQFELGLVGFAAFMRLKLQQIIPDLPVFFLNTGDFSYMVDEKFVKTNQEEIIQKVPRFVMRVDDIQPNTTENTNQYNKIFYQFEGQNYQCVVRRLCFNLMITTSFVSSNLVTALNHLEVLSTLIGRDNVYTYDFLGNRHQAAFAFQGFNQDIPSIDMGQGGTRNVTNTNQLELQIHILAPRIESIIPADDAFIEAIKFDLNNPKNNNGYEEISIEAYKHIFGVHRENRETNPYVDENKSFNSKEEREMNQQEFEEKLLESTGGLMKAGSVIPRRLMEQNNQ